MQHPTTAADQIKRVRERILALISDGDRAEADIAIAEILALQSQADIQGAELYIPKNTIGRTLDIGPVALKETPQGVLFQAKGSLSTLIDPRQAGLTQNLRDIIKGAENDFADYPEDERENLQAFAQAWLYNLQAPLFCNLSPEDCLDVATLLISILRKRSDELLSLPLKEETIDDALANARFHDAVKALGDIQDSEN